MTQKIKCILVIMGIIIAIALGLIIYFSAPVQATIKTVKTVAKTVKAVRKVMKRRRNRLE